MLHLKHHSSCRKGAVFSNKKPCNYKDNKKERQRTTTHEQSTEDSRVAGWARETNQYFVWLGAKKWAAKNDIWRGMAGTQDAQLAPTRGFVVC